METMVESKRDYYDVLGVARDADQAEIEKAFHKLALRYHPDRCSDSAGPARFKEASEAYAILSDPQKRREYDTAGFGGVAGYSYDDLFGGIDLGDIFGEGSFGLGESLFDTVLGRRRKTGPRKGEDVRVDLEISLQQVLTGCREAVGIARQETCPACDGNGAKAGTRPRTCANCHGSGQSIHRRREGNVSIQQITTCAECAGRGHFIDDPCPKCDGVGQVEREEKIEVQIPRGVEDRQALRIPKHGEPSPDPNGSPGDLYVVVHAKPDSRFQRRGPHLWCEEMISVPDAVLGTKLEIETLEDTVSVSIPAGTESGTAIPLASKGLPVFGQNERGNIYLLIKVAIPHQLSSQAEKLYQQLRALEISDGRDPENSR